jgi:uncharacterized protein (TIGR02284 family)
MWSAGITAAAVGGMLWRRRGRREHWLAWAASGADRDRIADVLSRLTATCVDGEQGFVTAAEGIKDPQIRALFRRYARQRRDFRLELERAARRFGTRLDTSGSVAGTLHHAWMDIKSTVTRGDEAAIVSEAERGEDSAVRAYREALSADLPADLRAIVERQFTEVQAAHDRVRDLERIHTRA